MPESAGRCCGLITHFQTPLSGGEAPADTLFEQTDTDRHRHRHRHRHKHKRKQRQSQRHKRRPTPMKDTPLKNRALLHPHVQPISPCHDPPLQQLHDPAHNLLQPFFVSAAQQHLCEAGSYASVDGKLTPSHWSVRMDYTPEAFKELSRWVGTRFPLLFNSNSSISYGYHYNAYPQGRDRVNLKSPAGPIPRHQKVSHVTDAPRVGGSVGEAQQEIGIKETKGGGLGNRLPRRCSNSPQSGSGSNARALQGCPSLTSRRRLCPDADSEGLEGDP
eukprot:1705448-Rhodomonas_salina.2